VSPTEDGAAEVFEGLLTEWLHVQVGLLVQCGDGMDGDQALPHVLTKMVVLDIQVLGPRAHFGGASQLQGAGVILKHSIPQLPIGGRFDLVFEEETNLYH
jgi:hypothetical protein